MRDSSTIFVLFSCNIWKEHSGMRIIAASTDMADIYKAIRREIAQGNMDFNGASKRTGVRLFNKSLAENFFSPSLLDYGYVDEFDNLADKRKNIKNKRRVAV